jgi:branched-chain amino acid transport system permease protein
MSTFLKRNRIRLIMLAILAVLFITAAQGMEGSDWVITTLRGLSVGAVIFLVAAGLSLIFGLMDVLNLAHGEMFMIGAYIGWTVYVRPDSFVDMVTPIFLLVAGFVLLPVWNALLDRLKLRQKTAQIWPWLAIILAVFILYVTLVRYPVSIWDHEVYAESPITYALALSQNLLVLPEAPIFEDISPAVALLGTLLGGMVLALGIAGLGHRKQQTVTRTPINTRAIGLAAVLVIIALLFFAINDRLTAQLLATSTTWRFFLAMAVAALSGVVLGTLVEVTAIRPLYDRPMYQIMITLGISFIGLEMVRSIWGRPEFTMPKPELFTGSGEGCPAESIGELLANKCSTVLLFGSRVRTYNEIFVILFGILVLVGIWLLLRYTRIGMIIRAGVQDSEMVEALGINVRQVFTLVFAMGVGLAAMGGVLAAPSMGLSNGMGTNLLLLALIALAIGGLTSFPGAAVGAILVGLMQQFIIKYGQIGINLPFLEEPFKPSPPLVPASVVLLMVIVLLVMPKGLFGRSD